MKLQWEYPVVFISFKGIKYNNFEHSLRDYYDNMISLIRNMLSDVVKDNIYSSRFEDLKVDIKDIELLDEDEEDI